VLLERYAQIYFVVQSNPRAEVHARWRCPDLRGPT
jgi:hypothetical protein